MVHDFLIVPVWGVSMREEEREEKRKEERKREKKKHSRDLHRLIRKLNASSEEYSSNM